MLNEETIKTKVILPYLDNLGLGVDEIEFEKNFSVRLGKSVFQAQDGKERNLAQGRSDILCKHRNKNLFIIEMKAEGIEFDQNDIDQGISYARLLDQIAPFVLLTNGKKTKVINTYTKKLLMIMNLKNWIGGVNLNRI